MTFLWGNFWFRFVLTKRTPAKRYYFFKLFQEPLCSFQKVIILLILMTLELSIQQYFKKSDKSILGISTLWIAKSVSTRATCPRKSVGCVIVRQAHCSYGYNGSLPKEPHCTDTGCAIYSGHCVKNSSRRNQRSFTSRKRRYHSKQYYLILYCSTLLELFQNLITAGITSIYYLDNYDSKTNKLVKDYLFQILI